MALGNVAKGCWRQGKFGLVLTIYAVVALDTAMGQKEPQLIPQPREMSSSGTAFTVTPSTTIALAADTPTNRFAAEVLQEEWTLAGEKAPKVVSEAEASAGPQIVLGEMAQGKIAELLAARKLNAKEIPAEGYVLDVGPRQVLVAGKDAAGTFHGVQTLRQMLPIAAGRKEIPGVRIRDWPALAYRGTQVDLSRGPVPKLETLKHIVRTIAEYKMNQLNLYMEDAFPLQGQPLVGALDDTLSQKDFRELVGYAARYHVDMIPATEGCGHLHKVLRFEKYADMAESPHGHDLATDDPAANRFLDDFYAQIHGVFPSRFYHLGCDETHELGTGRSAGRVQSDGYAKVYAASVKRAYDLVKRYDKQAIFWGDMAVAHPEVIPDLPKDLIVATWEYFPRPSYAKWIKPFSDAGMKVVVCPWVANTGLIIPNYDVAAWNIGNFTDEGKRAGAIGVNVTVWNDDGETLFAPNWWSIVYGAASAWEEGKTNVQEFDQRFDWVFFRNGDHRFTEALRNLSHVNEMLFKQGIPYMYSADFGGANDRLFWQDPFSAAGRSDAAKIAPVAGQIRGIAEDAFDVFSENAERARHHADTLKYLRFAALKIDALAMRYQYVGEVSSRYRSILDRKESLTRDQVYDELFKIQGINGPFLDLRDYATKLRGMYAELWLAENLGNWLPNMLQLYDRNAQVWQREIAAFEQVKADYRSGGDLPTAESLGFVVH